MYESNKYMIDQNGNNTTFSHVTINVVLKELRSINIGKTAGCDLIPCKLIKGRSRLSM